MATKLRWEFPATITQIEVKNPWMIVRSCLDGIDEQGQIIKTLYCTHNGRFFVRYADGWHKLEPVTNGFRQKQRLGHISAPKRGGSTDCSFMRQFGAYRCHRLVAYAWCEHPLAAKTDPLWYKHYEADHIDGDHGNWTAENLRWVTPAQNRAWAKRQRALRKLALNLKWIYPLHLRTLTELSQEQFDRFLVVLPEIMSKDPAPMSYTSLMIDIHKALKQMGVYDATALPNAQANGK